MLRCVLNVVVVSHGVVSHVVLKEAMLCSGEQLLGVAHEGFELGQRD